MEFLYPGFQKRFAFDLACEQIVRELQKRNWKVPGVSVEFYDYGEEGRKFRMVSWIKSRNFKLWFCRVQGSLNHGWNDIAGISHITIPERELRVYSRPEEGPNLYRYIGDDYERDREEFMSHTKYRDEDGRGLYLRYEGSCDCRKTAEGRWILHTHNGCRPPFLLHTSDRGQEYDLRGDEPEFFQTETVMKEFKEYLENVVLPEIARYPIPEPG